MKNSIEKFDLMGIQISNFTYSSLHNYIHNTIKNRIKNAVLNVNINAMNIASSDSEFYKILSSAGAVFADGMGIVYAIRLLGYKIHHRITYADWIWAFASFSEINGISWYLLGSKPGIAELASKKLKQRFPLLNITGCHHGYFKKQGAENKSVINDINQKRSDVLFVCLGMPQQEKWIFKYMDEVNSLIFLSGGACLEYVSGKKKRCPKWMGYIGLEWFFRLIQEPKRLLKRYIIGNPMFIYRYFKYYIFNN